MCIFLCFLKIYIYLKFIIDECCVHVYTCEVYTEAGGVHTCLDRGEIHIQFIWICEAGNNNNKISDTPSAFVYIQHSDISVNQNKMPIFWTLAHEKDNIKYQKRLK